LTERTKKYLEARDSGMTYEQIAEMFGVSKQRVAQACGKYQPSKFQFITEKGCIYPNWRNWMNKNKVSKIELVRRMGYVNSPSAASVTLREYMTGKNDMRKSYIDKLLEVTGMSYEVLFYRESKGDG
jgi:transcriptional regulator with XRE-family HTH domain